MNPNQGATFLLPDFQERFWKGLSPDISEVVEMYEEREDWACDYEHEPDLFVNLAKTLPSINEIRPRPEEKEILSAIIRVLAFMPFRQAVFSIAWLEQGSENEDQIGWGMMMYCEAVEQASSRVIDEQVICARVIRDRVAILIRASILTQIISKINSEK